MKVEYAPAASKQFSRLDKPTQSRIKKYMSTIASLDNPRFRGKALTAQRCIDGTEDTGVSAKKKWKHWTNWELVITD